MATGVHRNLDASDPLAGLLTRNAFSASADSVLVASEPLTRDVSAWREVPEYSMLYVRREDGAPRIGVVELDA